MSICTFVINNRHNIFPIPFLTAQTALTFQPQCTWTHALCEDPCSPLSPTQLHKSFIPPSLNWAPKQVLVAEVMAQDGVVGRTRRVTLHRGGHGDGCQQGGRGDRTAVEGQGGVDVFVLSAAHFCFVDHKDPVSRKIRKFFPLNQLHIHYSTGDQAPLRTALPTLSKALPPRDTRSVAVLTLLDLKSDSSQHQRQEGNPWGVCRNSDSYFKQLFCRKVFQRWSRSHYPGHRNYFGSLGYREHSPLPPP